MATYLERALKQVLEGEYDSNEHRIGRYHVVMKWDGYSAMIDINYLKAEYLFGFQVCEWDSLEKRLLLPSDTCLHGEKREKVVQTIKAIQNLGYELTLIQVEEMDDDSKLIFVDRTASFQKHITQKSR